MSYENVKNSRQHNKERILKVMGEKCCICGYNKCHSALELHHLNAEEKSFSISQNPNQAWEIIVKELPKTILVCANCHREIHAGIIDTPKHSTFNQEIADAISQELADLKTRTLYYCEECGAPVYRGNHLCPKCASKARRVVERPDREQLKTLIRNIPFTRIAASYGVTDNAVRKWCRSYNLPSKVSDIKNISDDEWEIV